MNLKSSEVVLFFRKSRPGGNFSIEASFAQMLEVFPRVVGYQPAVAEVPDYSNGLWPRIRMTQFAHQHRAKVNHITGDIHFIALGLPGKNTLLTVHDCGYLLHKKPIARFLLWLFWLKWPVAHCQQISAVSEATKQDIIRYTGCSPEKIQVVPTIIKGHFQALAKSFPADRPRILHIGTAQNKNLKRHIAALAGISCTLHIIGKLGKEELDLLQFHQIEYEHQYDLKDFQVQEAYEKCDLLLFASTLEGFGMPILEAQTVGRPVVTSNCSSMPEVAGDSACLVDPFSVESIRAGVLKVIEDAAYREALVAAGFKNIQRFHPETVARQYAELYQQLADLS
jgi:glycosyltransferase involved in cell wall biosynthesis